MSTPRCCWKQRRAFLTRSWKTDGSRGPEPRSTALISGDRFGGAGLGGLIWAGGGHGFLAAHVCAACPWGCLGLAAGRWRLGLGGVVTGLGWSDRGGGWAAGGLEQVEPF